MAMNSWDRAAEIMEQRAGARPRPRPRPATEAARRPRPQASTVTELGGKLDKLTAIVEAFEPSSALVTVPAPQPDAVAPVDTIEPDLSPEAMAKMSQDEFRAMSALRWSRSFDHQRPGSSPYMRTAPGGGPVAFVAGDDGA